MFLEGNIIFKSKLNILNGISSQIEVLLLNLTNNIFVNTASESLIKC